MSKKKTVGVYFKVTPEEREILKEKMNEAGVRNMSSYIRRMCLDGSITHVAVPELSECSRYLHAASNNLNQIARHLNSGGEYYLNEVEEISNALKESNILFRHILEKLTNMY